MSSTMRSVDTRFWSDGWVRKLNALDRYVFLYFLTNEHSSWCGVYEVDLTMIAFESGIDEHDLRKSILPRLSPKVLYIDGWVCIKNFEKYHANKSELTKKGIEAAWKEVPERIRLKYAELLNKKIPHTRGIQGVSSSSSSSSSSFASALAPIVAVEPQQAREIEKVIKSFEPVNPSISRLYGNTTQRAAVERMLKAHGSEKVLWAVQAACSVAGKEYAPVITTPLQLETKLGQLIAYVKKESSKTPMVVKI